MLSRTNPLKYLFSFEEFMLHLGYFIKEKHNNLCFKRTKSRDFVKVFSRAL